MDQSQIVCDGQVYIAPGSITVYGGPICYLVLQVVGLYAFLIAYDGGYFAGWQLNPVVFVRRLLSKKRGASTAGHGAGPEKTGTHRHQTPPDVLAETQRTEPPTTDFALRVQHPTKRFSSNTRTPPAVDDLTFGIAPGEVYASLGPNGAGKTTTISLIRGNLKPSWSEQQTDISINRHSLLSSNPQTRSAAVLSLGVCPQFDAIDVSLTTRQQLAFYARAAGIRVSEIKSAVDQILQAVGLATFKDRKAVNLSGGNKRKLMLAIAVVGAPEVLLLDEPSSGMDAVSKRVVWRALQRIRGLGARSSDLSVTATPEEVGQEGNGMAVLITPHSMEEVAALANLVGIMRRRMLAVGTKSELSRRFGDLWHVHLLLERPLAAGQVGNEAKVKRWIEHEVQGASIERRMLHGQVRFCIPRTGRDGNGGLVDVFRLLEANKESLGIEYYSVVQTNLEDVFLNVVGDKEED